MRPDIVNFADESPASSKISEQDFDSDLEGIHSEQLSPAGETVKRLKLSEIGMVLTML